MSYLNTYDICLKVIGPVFVGDGKEIGKKEYVFLPNNSIGIMDIEKLYGIMKSKGKAPLFESYMLKGRENLNQWLMSQKLMIRDVSSAIRYELQSCDVIDKRAKGLQVRSFVKDPYGKPYIPGSSVKGMLRTILLSYDIMKNKEKYSDAAGKILRAAEARDERKPSRKWFLQSDTQNIEALAYRTMERINTKPYDAVNDIMQGFVVSDSEPLSVRDLALCQKVEVHKDGEEKRLNILREAIKPGVAVHFTLTVDSGVCRYDADHIMKSVKAFAGQYYDNFLALFKQDRPTDNTVFLGGGAGFLSKTIIYPLFAKDGVDVAANIFFKTGVPGNHKHNEDRRLGVSPHILKCTHYDSRRYQFGECEMSIKEI